MSDDGESIEEQLEEELEEEQAGRHATNLELFLDLVFVFAISQLSRLIASDFSAAGVGRSVLVAWLVWGLWSQFSWLGTAIDVDRDVTTRLLFISSIFPTLFVAISLPEAYGANGGKFGLAILAGTVWVLGLQGLGLWRDPATRGPFIQYASFAGVTPVLVAVGGFLSDGPRIALWLVGTAIGIGGTLAANSQRTEAETSWRVDPVHFAERHALFVIIVLGEMLVAVGAAGGRDLTAYEAMVVAVAATLAAVLWWAYFGFVSRFGEEGLRHGHGVERARLARDFFTFGHFPIVVGVAFLATVVEQVVSDPTRRLGTDGRWLLMTAVVFVAGGFMFLQVRLRRKVAIERPIAVVAVAVLLWSVGGRTDGAVDLAFVAAVMTAMQIVTATRVARMQTAPTGLV